MSSLWIVHRDPSRRSALARLAGDTSVLVGPPGDRAFDAAPSPDVVLLGVDGDLEAELEFAHRMAPRHARTTWVVVADAPDLPEARRLFDTLPAEWLAYPPAPDRVRPLIDAARLRRRTEPLSERRTRDALAARFARWFGDLEEPELLRALDPHLARVPLLVRGEPGTGRGLLARYVHAFGGSTGGGFLAVPCTELRGADELAGEIERVATRRPPPSSLTVCLEDVDRLAPFLRAELRAWIELAPPVAVGHSTWLRWIGTAADRPGNGDGHGNPLTEALAGITVRLPALRERLDSLSRLVDEIARVWAFTYGEKPRRFSAEAMAALHEYPWPGNLRELEAVVLRALAADASDPVPAESLRFGDGAPLRDARLGSTAPSVAWPARTSEPAPALAATPAPPSAPPRVPSAAVVAPSPAPEPTEPVAIATLDDGVARRVLASIAHELRNPLVPIRTLVDLLPERFDDPEFRSSFAARVGTDVRRIEQVLDRMMQFASLETPRHERVDVSELLDALLEAHRGDIQARRLLVLKELDRSEPWATADGAHLRLALEGVLNRVLTLVPDQGDLYLASKHHPSALRGGPSLRVLLRFHGPRGLAPAGARGVSIAENSLDLLLAEAVIAELGGRLTIDDTDADETLLVIDLHA